MVVRWSRKAGQGDFVEARLSGALTVSGSAPGWLLYNGYQSWDRAGCASLPNGTGTSGRPDAQSWWTAGITDDFGAGLAAAAEPGGDAITRFESAGSEFSVIWSDGTGDHPKVLLQGREPGAWVSPTVNVAGVPDVRGQLAAMARGGLPATPVRGWVSWYHFGPFVTRDDVVEHSRLLAEGTFSQLGYRLIQLDDGWQQAYGEWTPNTKFPGGIRSLAEEVESRGQCLGIWTAPFLVSAAAEIAEQAPTEWFVTDPATGERLIEERHRVFGPMFALDASQSGVQEYLKDLYAGMYEAGVRFFKADFLYAGAYAGSRALAAGLNAIKEGTRDAYLLASGAPLLPIVGVAHGCRVGPDTATPLMDFEAWKPSPTVFSDEVLDVGRNLAARHFLKGWFQLDADVALVGGNLSLPQGRQLVTLAALAGGPFLASDDLTRLSPERLELLTNPEVLGLAGEGTAVPDWEPNAHDLPPVHWRHGDVLALFNWSAEDIEVEVRAPGARGARDLWARTEMRGFRDGSRLGVPANGVRLLRLDSG
ncbi:MAG: alpha-galactosidase [Candidatus Dormibacteraeota bacterium]|nr:alpha-galactosidase [Candidatus Dormibacteraeota bacterium]